MSFEVLPGTLTAFRWRKPHTFTLSEVLTLLFEVPMLLSEVCEPCRRPRRHWLCRGASTYYYRRIHFGV